MRLSVATTVKTLHPNNQRRMKAPPSTLSSRPKRSEGEGPAVRLSVATTLRTLHPNN